MKLSDEEIVPPAFNYQGNMDDWLIIEKLKMLLWERVLPIIMKNRGFRNGNVEPMAWLP